MSDLTTYSPNLCATLAALSALAYAPRGGSGREHLPVGVTGVTFFENKETDTQYIIATLTSGARVIAFRGSSSFADWLTNLNADFIQVDKDVNVHDGFNRAFQSVFVSLVGTLRDLRQRAPDAELYLTGHSLGGALAQLAALWLKLDSFDIAGIYTFGGPRVGNRGWRDLYQARLGLRTFRVVNREDPVPRLPSWLRGFRHAGNEVFLTSTGGEFGQPSPLLLNPAWDRKCISDLMGLWRGWFCKGKAALLPDHFIENYVKLAAWRQEVEKC